jgi:deazaflavin-dependent oxidoreductase (nitroreductase family)
MADLPEQLAHVAAYEASIRPGPVTAALRRVGRTRAFAAVYRRVGPVIDPRLARIRDGAILAKVYGFRALVLHTTGAKSGQQRESPLLYVRDGDDFAVVGTNFGQAKHPAWTANLLANPEAAIQVGPERLRVTAEQVDDAGFERLFPSFVEVYPGYADYIERRGGLVPRLFLLHPHA